DDDAHAVASFHPRRSGTSSVNVLATPLPRFLTVSRTVIEPGLRGLSSFVSVLREDDDGATVTLTVLPAPIVAAAFANESVVGFRAVVAALTAMLMRMLPVVV